MPKQGQFAKSVRTKKINQFKVKRQSNREVIDPKQFVDYVIVRFALTSKKKLAKAIQESNQRFLIELLTACKGETLDLTMVVPEVLTKLNSRVPWQFDRQIINGWQTLEHFIRREVPAVPLKTPVRVTGELSTAELTEIIAGNLAKKATAITFLKRPVSDQIKALTEQRLQQSIYQKGQIDWQQIATLFKPFPFQIDPQLDQPTKDWLMSLEKEK